jgi:uncharacterized protein YceK
MSRMALCMLALLAGCASITASEVAHQAMRGCPATSELHIDSTLTTTSTRVVCAHLRP